MTPTEAGTCEWLATEMAVCHLVERGELDPVVAEFQEENPYADATALAEHLVKLGILTTFQATRLLEGQGRGLVLGPYILADIVGAGSMGTVYKSARPSGFQAVRGERSCQCAGRGMSARLARSCSSFPKKCTQAVVPWLDVGTSAGLHYLVWPFAEGETLEAIVQRDGLLPRRGPR